MCRKLTLRIAAALVLITCLGHTVGTFMEVPFEQKAMRETIEIMKSTMVPMPVGQARSYMQILDGNNICTSLFLFVSGVLLLTVSAAPSSQVVNRVIFIVSLGLVGMAIISGIYFFPVPMILSGLAAILAWVACSRDS